MSGSALAAEVADYDAFSESTLELPVGDHLTGRTKQLVELGQILDTEGRLGVPTVFFAGQDPKAPSLRAMGLTQVEAARRHLFDYAQLYRLPANVLAEAPLKELHDLGRGAIIATFTEQVQGTPVFRDAIHVVMDRDYKLVAITGYVSPHQSAKSESWKLSRQTAISTAFMDLTGQAANERQFFDTGMEVGGYHYFLQQPSSTEGSWRANERIRVKDVYFSLADALVPAYFVELDVGQQGSRDSKFFTYVISGVDGRLLFRHNLTAYDSFNYRVWAETTGWKMPYDGPQGTVGTPHPTGIPDGYQAPFIAPNLVSVEALPFSHQSSDFWLPSGATETTGNNVEAYADISGNDGFDATDVRADTTSLNTFDYTYDVTLEPDANLTQQKAAVTQLFFMNNFMHDWYYDHGFDEAAGNAQASNYNRGGEENDSIRAEGQDFSGTDNSNMATPPDGSRPIMQMYMFHSAVSPLLTVNTPALGNMDAENADFGPQGFDVTADVVYPLDSTSLHTGCAPFAAASLSGKIVLIDRGGCTFTDKVQNAQDAGAVGTIIANNLPGAPAMGMGGSSATISIAAVSVGQADGVTLKNAIGSGTVNIRVYRAYAPMRDGTIDNAIIAHEWAHYLAHRLVGDASGLENNQGKSMGEGWSDFNALLMMVRDTDSAQAVNANFGGVYAAATYVTSGGTNNGYYFGIRRVPYSTDMSKNPLTFHHISNAVALPNSAPLNPNGGPNAEVHNSGEVWCTMLWEGFVGLLNETQKYTFDQARSQMQDYLVASLKATPIAPTMIEARDALMAVIYASDKDDFNVFATAFAKRGAGNGAIGPARYSTTHSGVVESYTVGGDAKFATFSVNDNTFWCDHDGALDNGETGLVQIQVKNIGWIPLTGLTATVTSSTPGVTIGNNGQTTFTTSQPFGIAYALVPISITGATGTTTVSLGISFDDPSFAVPGAKSASVQFRANWDETLGTSATDDVEAPTSAWTIAHDPSLSGDFPFQIYENDPQDHEWYVPNPGGPADSYLVSPPLNVDPSADFSFTMDHRWYFEADSGGNYDGAVIEISTDNGATWSDIGQAVAAYNGTLVEDYPGTTQVSDNPLHGRPAFVAQSPNWASGAWITQTFDFGTAYAGQTVLLRFRVGADEAVAAVGWEIDNISFSGITNTPFSQLVADRGICVNRPPIAKPGPDQTVDERTLVTLDGSQSSDADGDPLTLTWTQTSGPIIQWTGNGTFVAPEVKVDTDLTFLLVASDGTLISQGVPTKVTVRQVNRKPTAVVPPPAEVNEREPFTLDASQSFDIDGDPIATYQWTQVDGPAITLDDATAQKPSFTAPEVMSDTQAKFQLVVTDGDLSSDPVIFELTIKQVNRAPTVTIADQGTAPERTQVTLTATGADPDEEDVPNLRYVWSQVDGPAAQLTVTTGNTLSFIAPEVTEDTPVTFKVEVTDGDETRADRLSGEATVTFTVQQVNRAPVAMAGSDRTVPSFGTITIGGASNDPDGDDLTYTWKQVGGPEVTLGNADRAMPFFTAPEVKADTEFRFQLTVTDGALTSAPDEVVVTVTPALAASGCGCNAGDNGLSGATALLALGALAFLARRRRVL